MERGPNHEKVVKLFEQLAGDGLTNIHFSWAEGAEKLSPEERAAAMAEWMEESVRHSKLTNEEKMLEQIPHIYEHVSDAMDALPRKTIEQFANEPWTEQDSQISKAWGNLDMALVLLGNWLSKEAREKIRQRKLERKTKEATKETVDIS